MAKKILYKNHCTPQEQITAGGRYYLDSDCGRKLTGSYLLTLGSGTTTTGTLTATGTLGAASGFDFISVKVVSGDDVGLSFDATTNPVIKLKEGECFSSEIIPAAEPKIIVTGTSTVEYTVHT
jgi:hypothetical protein